MPTKTPRYASDPATHSADSKTQIQSATKGHTTLSELDTQIVPTKKQIDDYAEKEEERYNKIATDQKNTHTLAKLASKLVEWEERIDGKGK